MHSPDRAKDTNKAAGTVACGDEQGEASSASENDDDAAARCKLYYSILSYSEYSDWTKLSSRGSVTLACCYLSDSEFSELNKLSSRGSVTLSCCYISYSEYSEWTK